MTAPTTDKACLEALLAIEQHGTQTKAAAALGVTRFVVQHRKAIAEQRGITTGTIMDDSPSESCKWNEGSDSATLVITTKQRIRTLEEALEYAEADLDMWEASKFGVTSHEQGQKDADGNPTILRLWNVRATLRRREPNDPMRVKDEVKDWLSQSAPKIPSPPRRRKSKRPKIMLEVSCPDIHFGKLSDSQETGEDYNLEIARNLYLSAHQHIIDEASKRYAIDKIVNVPSNDILHFAGSSYATTSGTRQDYAATWQRVYKTARETAKDAILMLRDVAQVDVITHTDNHARDEAFYLADALACYFNKDKHVTVDDSPMPHKFVTHGGVLIGFGHGHNEKYADLQGIMAKKMPEAFARATWKEWHLGHLHKDMLIDGFHDLMFRRLSSLSGTDSWHAGKGYSSRKSATGMIWSEEGLESTIYFTPKAEDYAT
jgi:hypothetical protein